MSKRDTKSIKYVLDEMDPAEKIEFEREIKCDPDLLIEVESIKRMQKKVTQLPTFAPPHNISESVLTYAANRASRSDEKNFRFYISAAVLILGLTAGSFMMENPFETEGNPANSSVQFSSPSPIYNSETQTSSSNTTPWVDRNNILKLGGLESGNFNSRATDFNDNSLKLRPADELFYRKSSNHSLQLTGNNRR